MAIALVQSNEGTSATATTTATFSVAPTSGNLVVLCFAADDYNGTPDTGWTQSTGMEQQGNNGGYIWWRISTGTNSFPYTIGSATNSAWVLAEFSGAHATPYDISSGQFANSGGSNYTTPSITPTSGARVLVAAITASNSGGDMSADMTTWLSSFTHIRSSGPASATGTRDAVGAAYLLVTANGSTAYSSGASYPYTILSKDGLIISFKDAGGAAATSLVFDPSFQNYMLVR
jgi:hypothetical protein